MIRGLVAASVLSVIFVTLSGVAMALGAAIYDPPPLLAQFGRCGEYLCWNGIVPGVTSREEAHAALLRAGYQEVPRTIAEAGFIASHYRSATETDTCRVGLLYDSMDIARLIRFNPCTGFRVGDLILAAGRPDAMANGSFRWEPGPLSARVRWTSHPLDGSICPDTATPYSDIVYLLLESLFHSNRESAPEWRGFMPYWQYSRRFAMRSCRAIRALP